MSVHDARKAVERVLVGILQPIIDAMVRRRVHPNVLSTMGFLGYGYYLVYWKPRKACADGTACAQPFPNRIVKIALWVATILVAAAVAFPYVAQAVLGA